MIGDGNMNGTHVCSLCDAVSGIDGRMDGQMGILTA
jgi:hypothetical protein